jgi:hypothetical protein
MVTPNLGNREGKVGQVLPMCDTPGTRTTVGDVISTATRLPKPAAWRLALAPPPAPTPVADGHGSAHSHLISPGLLSDLGDPVTRWLMSGAEIHPEAHTHVAVHRVSGLDRERRASCTPHEHAFPELNLILPITGLIYEIILGDERYDVEGPASIFIPAGLPHSANVKAGTGFFVEIVLGSEPVVA